MRKIAIIGSRHFTDYDRLERVLQPWLPALKPWGNDSCVTGPSGPLQSPL